MYPKEIKQAAADMHAEGKSASYICSELGICRSTLFLWIKQSTPDKTGKIPREQYLKELELAHVFDGRFLGGEDDPPFLFPHGNHRRPLEIAEEILEFSVRAGGQPRDLDRLAEASP